MSKPTIGPTATAVADPALALMPQPQRAAVHRTGIWWTLRDLLRRRQAQLGGAIVLLLVLCAVFAPYLAPYDPYAIDVKDRLLPPSPEHLFGTDDLGRDMFSRVLYGARTTIQAGLVVILIAATFGSVIGLISGYYGGKTDLFTMRFIDIMLAFPYILLALAIVATLGPSLQNALIAIGIAFIPGGRASSVAAYSRPKNRNM